MLLECRDCGEFPDCPMLKPVIWDKIAPRTQKKDHLCFNCAEIILGREITVEDLWEKATANKPWITLLRRANHPRK